MEYFIVVCRGDRTADGEKGDYVFATSKLFKDKQSAQIYALSINHAREPIVVKLDFSVIIHLLRCEGKL